jgi:hypothetical protein
MLGWSSAFHDIGKRSTEMPCQPGFRSANRDRLKLITRDAVPNSCPMLRSFGCEKSAERAVLPRAANCMCGPRLLRPGNPDALAPAWQRVGDWICGTGPLADDPGGGDGMQVRPHTLMWAIGVMVHDALEPLR